MEGNSISSLSQEQVKEQPFRMNVSQIDNGFMITGYHNGQHVNTYCDTLTCVQKFLEGLVINKKD
tara:strand:- start:261 stop:455 length:195 start_codon:yes stop_codon:yes gene_type:complete